MATKQTAVEWIYERLERMIPRDAIYNMDKQEYFKQAKQMEKEQIKDAFTDGCIGELYELNAYYTSEKYYNQTYKQQENENNANKS
jgi:hypothetical protein